jgi:hypothetical protein
VKLRTHFSRCTGNEDRHRMQDRTPIHFNRHQKKGIMNMKRKNSPHSMLSETQSLSPTREAIDYRGTGAVRRRSFVRKMGIAGA